MDTNHGFILATTLSPASVNDTNYLDYCTVFSKHTKTPIKKGYAGKPNRDFLAGKNIADGIMRKDSTTAKLTDLEIERNKKISKVRYIVEQYFGISHLKDNAQRARFPQIDKNKFDGWYRQAAYNIAKGLKIPKLATVWVDRCARTTDSGLSTMKMGLHEAIRPPNIARWSRFFVKI